MIAVLEDGNVYENVVWWTCIVTFTTQLAASIYAFVVILKKPETRKNFFLLSVTTLHFLSAALLIRGLFYNPKMSNPVNYAMISFSLVMGNWVFTIFLFKTALTLPLLFVEKASHEERQDEIARIQENKAKKIDWAIFLLLLQPGVQVAIAFIGFGFDSV